VTLASIVIPHYRTLDRLELCLRCLERFTPEPHERIIVDNGSDPATLEALRTRRDILLLERQQGEETGHRAHANALDLGISRSRGEYIVTIHSDLFVRREGWLSFLIGELESGPYEIVAPGTQHIQPYSLYERARRALGGERQPRRLGPVFTIYRRRVFEPKRFADFEKVWQIAEPHREAGRTKFIGREEAARWAFHSGGTTKLSLFAHRRKAAAVKSRQFEAFLAQPEIRALANPPASR
jgi:glycosyltransferase involved in cell wall biosynthesis